MNDSKIIKEWYDHPPKEEGQGVYVMFTKDGDLKWCPSGNELRRIHEIDPSQWMSGPIFLSLSKADDGRIREFLEDLVNNF